MDNKQPGASSSLTMFKTFEVYFSSIAGYIQSLSIFDVDEGELDTLEMKPPEDWCDVILKRMNRKQYYENPHHMLDWKDGELDQRDLRDALHSVIDDDDYVMVNTKSKAQRLELEFGFLNVHIIV